MRILTHIYSIAAVLATAAILFFSCESEKENTGPVLGERDSLPWLKSQGVSTLISDSGIIRYKLISEDWFMYDKKDPTYWAFEKGFFMEKFDENYHVEAFINCDTAYYYDQRHLWELRSRVFIKNTKGETFKTTLLYWDQNIHEFYSPAYMEIIGETQSLRGTNFRSNEQMTQYSIHMSSGAFPFDEGEEPQPEPQPEPDTLQTYTQQAK